LLSAFHQCNIHSPDQSRKCEQKQHSQD
jgi:hypothetical protein